MSHPRTSLLAAVCLLLLPGRPACAELPDSAEIGRLIQQLGSDSFKEREAATKRLGEIGESAASALRHAAKSPDPEVRQRAEGLLVALDRRRDYDTLRGTWVVVEVQTEHQHLLV